jgi:hypothetical protein
METKLQNADGQDIILRQGNGSEDPGKMSFNSGCGLGAGAPGCILFMLGGHTEVLRIEQDGAFFVCGRKVETDRAVYDAFVSWLKGAHP